MLAVRFAELALEPLLLEVLARQLDRRRGEVDARDDRAAARKARQVGAGAAAHFEHPFAAPSVEVDQPQEVMQFFEVILIEIAEESRRSHRMRGDLEIVNVVIPVVADVGRRRMTRRMDTGSLL